MNVIIMSLNAYNYNKNKNKSNSENIEENNDEESFVDCNFDVSLILAVKEYPSILRRKAKRGEVEAVEGWKRISENVHKPGIYFCYLLSSEIF